ncbi:DNA gyrase subunit A [candidate division TA06 bacterium]|uniref:DNA gyrase subunit A n=1 Tax=candidate division TA06 bacterium TaxID=2250710 RepID=A0A933I8F9_UNCT6|nr:DNA gyrase subunit A [candidate division TA06 bacterium]
MALERNRVLTREIEEEMRSSYLDYSMSVIVGRALPDVRDGLKPVHRRILYAMSELGLAHNKPFKKSARIVGEVMGKYHPHGDSAIYDSMVRMAQDFSLRYLLVDGQGNFGSVDGDPPAAQRYTEARLARISDEVLKDIDKETVTYVDNYDGSLKEPSVLPSLLPGLLVNGSSGIAVGMATNIPPHNLGEICDAISLLIDDPELAPEKLLKTVKGPDFPTGGMIMGVSGIRDAYLTGRGKITIRGRANVETAKNGKESIIISELPYEVNKAGMIEKIAELVKDKKMDGIADLRDESDRDGMRVVIGLKRDSDPRLTINQLYQHTQFQTSFGVIMLALVDGVPRVITLKEALAKFIEFRVEVVTRRTKYELAQAEKRAHILEGLKIAIDNIDEVVRIIKKSPNVDEARSSLMKKFKLSEIQAQAILDMTLKRLTALETKKIDEEYEELLKLITRLKGILDSRRRLMGVIREEIAELKKKYADSRRTEILAATEEKFSVEDLIAEEDMVITISHAGYIKRLSVSSYKRQGRGGKGVTGMTTKEEDFVEGMFIASTHHYILFFTDKGHCYWLKVYEVPEGGRAAKGRQISNLLELKPDEKIAAYIAVKEFDEQHFVVMATREGTIKKTALSEFSNPRKAGIIAATVDGKDLLIEAKLTDGSEDIILVTTQGQACRFHESDVRAMGRSAAGVRGITLDKKDLVVGMVAVKREGSLLTVCQKGFGKRSEIEEYRVTRRGGKGVITMKITDKTGPVVAVKEVVDTDELMIISAGGQVIRLTLKNVRVMGRATQGVRLINLEDKDQVVDVARLAASEEEGNGEANGNGAEK